MLINPLKLVIWDLDDTFWHGTLTEGGVTVDSAIINIVITLAARGIISSICSKNDFEDAKAVLQQRGVWDFFVLPRIAFAAKGSAIAEIIEQVNLRPDNVLFIDDNLLNLEEAKHFAPGIMTAHPDDILPTLLDLPQAKGKDDRGFARLKQYKQFEQKVADRSVSQLAQEDFLRQCEIQIDIDIDVEPHLDRVIELINRSNQLNFTKSQVETDEARAAFKDSLRQYAYHAGVINVRDKYGDYGLAGFFLIQRLGGASRLLHFVFSCRIMNMGVEQYIYDLLKQPTINIVRPVANSLDVFDKVDWIQPYSQTNKPLAHTSNEKLLLLGGCDLMQVATYCSANRAEYANRKVRFDDPGFILSDRQTIANSTIFATVPCWTQEEITNFDNDLADSHTLVISLADALRGAYMVLEKDILVRIEIGLYFSKCRIDDPYVDQASFIQPTIEQKLMLLTCALDRIVELSPQARHRFLLGCNTRGLQSDSLARSSYNKWASEYCSQQGTFSFISVDMVPEQEIIDSHHFTRKGYFFIASRIIEEVNIGAKSKIPNMNAVNDMRTDFHDIIKAAQIIPASEAGLLPAKIVA